jgi:hypothetical protein
VNRSPLVQLLGLALLAICRDSNEFQHSSGPQLFLAKTLLILTEGFRNITQFLSLYSMIVIQKKRQLYPAYVFLIIWFRKITQAVEKAPFNRLKTKLRDLSPRANYTDRATALVGEVSTNFLRIEGAAWSARRIPTAVISIF